jgi:hypothetical protein
MRALFVWGRGPLQLRLVAGAACGAAIGLAIPEPSDPQARLVRGFAVDRWGGKIDVRDDSAGHAMVATLKAKMQRRVGFQRRFGTGLNSALCGSFPGPLSYVCRSA